MSTETKKIPYSETPLIKSFPISSRVPFQVYLKTEFVQPSGSFKSRGLGYLVSAKIEEASLEGKKVALFSSSGGNAGLATLVAGEFFQVPCTVVLPVTSKLSMKQKIESTGANVIIHGAHWGEADEYLRTELIAKVNSDDVLPVYCHPFDNELIWEGHSSMIDEIKEQLGDKLPKLKAIVCSVGGGGLYCGVVRGLVRNGLNVPVVAIETKPAPTLHNAIELGKVVKLDSVNTIATSLASPYTAEEALRCAQSYPTHSVLIEDQDTLTTLVQFVKDHNVIVEPACSAALTAVYKPEILTLSIGELEKDDVVIVIACGGAAYGLEDINKLL